MSKKTEDKLNVVVVGGGYGATAARQLSAKLDASKYNLILINSRPYRFHLPAFIRLVVSDVDNLEKTAMAGYEKLFHNNNGTFIQASVTGIQKSETVGGSVILDNGEKVPFHVLILATGSTWSGPLDFPNSKGDISAFLTSERSRFQDANDIVLVGGGSVGIEYAGEIKDIWPNKKVTIIHGGSKLLNDTYPDRFRNKMENGMKSRGVEIVYNDYLDDIPTSGAESVTTRKGKTIKGDLFVPAWGPKPNTGFIASSLPGAVTDKGFVKIKPTLQFASYPEIFALGDILDWKEQKQAAKANAHAALISTNVLNYLDGKPLKEYKGSYELILVTNGKNGGAAYFGVLWGIVLGDWAARLTKSKTLLIPMFQAAQGL
ncbi:uncharacterized protein EV420DRAFT_1511174 [Desarmillaria tabescens]|uniref:FAD/NAD(P)-binding domain-containing protein n=1 Tax=Armillaria tabescens TaxID=1929756 RepID=A0AA39T5R0_ARMTA|nr:uncharacterized protein EV420DRAFT_1511174 [Desarmillaria tabescens]KAK0466346.1 hypothetical protein EV420DRAFT_1511174 [Desarmillaria tabescens]